ncbi:MAG TPA: hypothetical protein VMA74_13395, partial [Dyella sp.]|uniref:hypothetical protein n=1 Tax=Dyella sp. TaxID=1869338 RepID=UPI002CAA52D0
TAHQLKQALRFSWVPFSLSIPRLRSGARSTVRAWKKHYADAQSGIEHLSAGDLRARLLLIPPTRIANLIAQP